MEPGRKRRRNINIETVEQSFWIQVVSGVEQ